MAQGKENQVTWIKRFLLCESKPLGNLSISRVSDWFDRGSTFFLLANPEYFFALHPLCLHGGFIEITDGRPSWLESLLKGLGFYPNPGPLLHAIPSRPLLSAFSYSALKSFFMLCLSFRLLDSFCAISSQSNVPIQLWRLYFTSCMQVNIVYWR